MKLSALKSELHWFLACLIFQGFLQIITISILYKNKLGRMRDEDDDALK